MKRNGFALIELLAVIVILAIIALIAIPIVISIINDSKKSSAKESIKLYLDTVEKTIAKKQMEKPNFKPTECTIGEDKTITCDEEKIEIEIKGEIPKSGTIKFGKGMIISGGNIELNNLYYQVTNGEVSDGTAEKVTICKLISKNGAGEINSGDKYTCEVIKGMEEPYTFYVLSIEEDKVNLIMNNNICNDGTIPTSSNTCLIEWYDDGDNLKNYENDINEFGPVTAIQGLYNATKNWTNVPDMDLSGNNKYSDEGQESNSNYGYGEIITTELGIKITKKDKQTEVTIDGNEIPVILYEEGKPLKTRLPKLEEVYNTGTDVTHCHDGVFCPAWLTNGLKEYQSYYPGNEHISGIYGYWLLSSYSGSSHYASYVSFTGHMAGQNTSDGSIGIRPVITVSKDDLS